MLCWGIQQCFSSGVHKSLAISVNLFDFKVDFKALGRL